MEWKYYTPKFEGDYHFDAIKNSAWSGHLKFAYDLVRFMKPKQIVELGTHHGASFLSFCQAVKDENCSTISFAVDTWKGDRHTGFYEETIYRNLKSDIEKYYPNLAKMLRMTFDDALNLFTDESIDILHIDGYHTFEAVSHDFKTWLPKVSKNGIILFHDIAVRYSDFGVYKLWDMLKSQYPTIQFEHSSGLGILFPKGYHSQFEDVLQREKEFQTYYQS